jgi:NADH:ubiquinone oxidoreductase subunit 2 (subunit N)
VQPWFLALAIVGVANAAIAAAYYLRVVATMYFRSAASAAAPIAVERGEPTKIHEPAPAIATAICLVLVIVVGVIPWPALEASDAAGAAVSRLPAVESTNSDARDTAQVR